MSSLMVSTEQRRISKRDARRLLDPRTKSEDDTEDVARFSTTVEAGERHSIIRHGRAGVWSRQIGWMESV
jgi:hypothetical protein